MILVKWVWKCDLCGIELHHEYETCVYSDEMARDNRGWVSDLEVPEEYRTHPTDNICDACPECKEKPDWSKYPNRRMYYA